MAAIYGLSYMLEPPQIFKYKKWYRFVQRTLLYYISKLVHALWLVNLADRTLLYGPLKLNFFFVAKLLRDLSPNFLNLWSK